MHLQEGTPALLVAWKEGEDLGAGQGGSENWLWDTERKLNEDKPRGKAKRVWEEGREGKNLSSDFLVHCKCCFKAPNLTGGRSQVILEREEPTTT